VFTSLLTSTDLTRVKRIYTRIHDKGTVNALVSFGTFKEDENRCAKNSRVQSPVVTR
jgi:hypothetical protein